MSKPWLTLQQIINRLRRLHFRYTGIRHLALTCLACLILLPGIYSCLSSPGQRQDGSADLQEAKLPRIDTSAYSLSGRFAPPAGAERIQYGDGSFAAWLRELPLKPAGSLVHYYDGRVKKAQGVYCAVINMDIGTRDLQQCADAVMRLRAEYLYSQGRFGEIHFNYVSDGKPRYFLTHGEEDTSYVRFRKYLDQVFSYANTRSLKEELIPVNGFEAIEAGNVFIQSGQPYGHAIIIVDMARDTSDGSLYFIAAQSYMPAQETQVLVNNEEEAISPWYRLKDGIIHFPEWTFSTADVRRFP